MTAFSLGARLPLGANSALALSLPQSFVAAKRRQKPAPSSEGAEAATAAEHGGYLGEDRGAEIRAQFASVAIPYQNVPRPAAHLNAPKGRASCGEAALHVPKARFIPRRGASFAARTCRHSLVSSGSKREWRYRKSRQSGSENTAVHTACGAITV